MDTQDQKPYALIQLPLDLGGGRTLTALHQTDQFPEAIEGDPASGWVEVPAGCVLTEAVYDAPAQTACTLRLALDPAGAVAAQIAVQMHRR